MLGKNKSTIDQIRHWYKLKFHYHDADNNLQWRFTIYPSHWKQHNRLQSSSKAIKLLPTHAFTSVRQHKHITGRLPTYEKSPYFTLLEGNSNQLIEIDYQILQTSIYNASLKKSCPPSGKPMYTQEARVGEEKSPSSVQLIGCYGHLFSCIGKKSFIQTIKNNNYTLRFKR